MEILIKRITKGPQTTLGRLYVDGVVECYTLEDTDRGLHSQMPLAELKKIKIHGRTAIPTGRVKLGQRESPKFKRYLPWLLDVLGFEYVYIHPGNKHQDTDGCILPGCAFLTLSNGDYYVTNSKAAFDPLWEKIQAAWGRGEVVWCEVRNDYAEGPKK